MIKNTKIKVLLAILSVIAILIGSILLMGV